MRELRHQEAPGRFRLIDSAPDQHIRDYRQGRGRNFQSAIVKRGGQHPYLQRIGRLGDPTHAQVSKESEV
jgi:hypothetical protein